MGREDGGDPGQGPRGITRLYLLESRDMLGELTWRMAALKRILETLKSEPARDWRVDVAYKTLVSAAAVSKGSVLMEEEPPRRKTAGGGGGAGTAEAGGESLYVVKSSEFPDRTFMMAAKNRPADPTSAGGASSTASSSMGRSSRGGSARDKLLSPIVETGLMGDEIICALKGYSNRVVLTIQGTAYRIGGGYLQACVGTVTKGSPVSAIALQVRYENSTCPQPQAHAVMEELVALCLAGQQEAEAAQEEQRQQQQQQQGRGPASASAVAAGGAKQEGAASGLRVRPIDPQGALKPSLGTVPGFDPARDVYGPRLTVLQYVELLGST